MADKPSRTKPTRFAIRLDPYLSASHYLQHGRGSEIDPVLLAAEIRQHGFATMPADVQAFVCDFLEGNIEKRGRKGNSAIERQLQGRRAQGFYYSLREVQSGAEDPFPAAVEIYEALRDDIKDSYSPSEFVWRMVAVLMRGNQGHHKAVKNLAGEVNSTSKPGGAKPARK